MEKSVFQGLSDDDEIIVKNDTEKVENVEKKEEVKVEDKVETPEKKVETPEKKVESAEKKVEQTEKKEEKVEDKGEEEGELSFELKLEDDHLDEKKPDTKFDFKNITKDLDISLEEDVTELSQEAFVEKVKEKIETSKEKFSYQNMPEDVVDVVKFFAEEGGTTADLLADNDVVLAEVYLAMGSEAKFVRFQSDKLTKIGLSDEQATERAKELWDQKSEKEQAQAVSEIDNQLVAFKNQAIKEIVNTRKEIVNKQKVQAEAKAKAERTKMVDIVKNTTEFMNMPISKDVQDKLIRKIENGDIDKVLNNAAAKAKVDAFMLALFGKQIQDTSKKLLTDQARESYNKGVGKLIEKNHNVKPERKEKGQQTEQKRGGFNFSNIDDDN